MDSLISKIMRNASEGVNGFQETSDQCHTLIRLRFFSFWPHPSKASLLLAKQEVPTELDRWIWIINFFAYSVMVSLNFFPGYELSGS